VINAVQSLRLFRKFVQRITGIDARRAYPKLTRHPLKQSNRDGLGNHSEQSRCVVLFNDTYANYFEPGVGRSAIELLIACGYQVELANAGCCQRPRLSKGLVKDAKRDGEATLRQLLPFAEQGRPILFLEPSCASAIVDDLPDLVDDAALGQAVKANCYMLEDFLADRQEAGQLAGRLIARDSRLLLHGHCHQKALFGTAGLHRLFNSIQGLDVSEVDSGCCGMAGSFGYEHHDLSMQIGEQRLFPAVREAEQQGVTVCASGFSCRHQIKDGCDVQAMHWVELVGFESAQRQNS